MSDPHNIWHRRQHLFDRLFPYTLTVLAIPAACFIYLITKAEPVKSSEHLVTNPIIAKQIAMLEAKSTDDSNDATVETGNRPESNGLINLRIATDAELESLPGIGEKRAAQIIALRQSNEIQSVDDLEKIKGIGSKLLGEIKGKVTWE